MSAPTESLPAAVEMPAAPTGARHGLRRKALVALAIFALYIAGVGLLLGRERSLMLQLVEELERVHQQEELLGRVSAATANAILHASEAYVAAGREPDWRNVALGVEAVEAGLFALSKYVESAAADANEVAATLPRILRLRDPQTLLELRSVLYQQVRKLDVLTGDVRLRKKQLHEQYRFSYDALSLTAALAGGLGLAVSASVVALFFTRIAWDVKRLQERAAQIVGGYRGPPLPVTRHDEIGTLIESINRMQGELRQREATLELAREERLHKEKMAAVGSLAASIAHEINNPIAAITGVAEEIAETSAGRQCPHHGAACRPELILEHARRVATITRQIAVFSAPASPDFELLDLNALIDSTCNFVRYDPRYRSIDLRVELDRQMPAVELVADHLTQVLMNLLVNAADAIGEAEGRRGQVTVVTRRDDGHAVIEVADNGIGMDAETLEHAFDEYFSTKPSGKGSGLGLALCRRLVQRMGGTIEIASVPAQATVVHVALPIERSITPVHRESEHVSAGH